MDVLKMLGLGKRPKNLARQLFCIALMCGVGGWYADHFNYPIWLGVVVGFILIVVCYRAAPYFPLKHPELLE